MHHYSLSVAKESKYYQGAPCNSNPFPSSNVILVQFTPSQVSQNLAQKPQKCNQQYKGWIIRIWTKGHSVMKLTKI